MEKILHNYILLRVNKRKSYNTELEAWDGLTKKNKIIICDYGNTGTTVDWTYQKFWGLCLAAQITTTSSKSMPGSSTSFPLVQ